MTLYLDSILFINKSTNFFPGGATGVEKPVFWRGVDGGGRQLVRIVLSEGSRLLPHRSLMPEAYLPEVDAQLFLFSKVSQHFPKLWEFPLISL